MHREKQLSELKSLRSQRGCSVHSEIHDLGYRKDRQKCEFLLCRRSISMYKSFTWEYFHLSLGWVGCECALHMRWQRAKKLVTLPPVIISDCAIAWFENSQWFFWSPFYSHYSSNGLQPHKVPCVDLTWKYLQGMPYQRSVYYASVIFSQYSYGQMLLVLMFSLWGRLDCEVLQARQMLIVGIMIDIKLASCALLLCWLSRSLGR